jgi:hypothetical protein
LCFALLLLRYFSNANAHSMKTSLLLRNKLFVLGYSILWILFSTNSSFAQKEAEKIKTHLQANASKHHLSGNDIQEMTISSAYLSPTTGWYHVYYNQVYQSIEVYNGVLNATLVNDKVEYVGNNFVENIAAKVPSGIMGSQLSPLNAISKAAVHLGLSHNAANTKEESVTSLANGQVSKSVFSNVGLSNEAIPVKLYWYPHTDSVSSATSLHLAWSVEIYAKDHKNYWVTQVDAYSGEVLAVDDQVIKCNLCTPEHTHQHSQLQNPPADSPVQSQTSVAPVAPNSYNVFDYPVESPIHGARTIVTNPYTRFVPPGTGPGATNGWHNDGVTDYASTRGNNVLAKEDVNADNDLTIGQSPTSATLNFDYPYTQALNTSEGNRNAAITNLFFWNNLIHDILWKYGFDEPSGNFQRSNMGRGGLGNDYVLADAQDGKAVNNAYFNPGIDGQNGRMEMLLWTSPASYQPDSDFDNGVISHEYGHGWSIRLTGGPANSSCLANLEQAGEGWSDYLALMLTTDWSTLTPSVASANIVRGMGNYVNGGTITDPGIRPYPYSYDMANVNSAVTYDKVGLWPVPHGVGSIWATTLWDMTWEIIFQDNQIASNIYNTSEMVGNVAALKLVNEGLRLQKCNPSFIDSRNAILKADSLLFNSRYHCAIWKAFTRRGMGVNASSGNSSNDRIVIQSFTPMTNNGWVLGSPRDAVVCSHSVFNYTATIAGAGTPTFGWARAAVPGISNASKSGNSATINETLINTTNNPIEVTYKFYLTPTSCQAPIDVKVVVNPAPKITLADYEVCKDGTVPAGQGLEAVNQPYTNTVSGVLNTASPTYVRGLGNHYPTYLSSTTVHYHTHTFVAPATETVSIEVVAASFSGLNPYDSYMTLYHTAFYPSNPEINFLMGDDDSGVLQYASEITYDLVAGTTYILVVATYSMNMVGSYQIQATADIFGGPKTWYANSSGGSALATGNIFNPVGVAGSGIAGTGTPLSKTFYLESSPFTCRATATFTINSPTEGGSIAGSATACADLNKGELTLSGHSGDILRWEFSTNNFTDVTQLAETAPTIVYTNLTQTTQYRVVVKNGACNAVNSAIGTITRTSPYLPEIDNYSICQYSQYIGGKGLYSYSYSPFSTISGTLFNESPTYRRGDGNNMSTYVGVGQGGESVFYRVHTFTAPGTSSISIETIGGTLNGQSPYDTYLSLYHTYFNPAAPATNFLKGDNDSGTLQYGSKITHTLISGNIYILVVASKENGVTGNYQLQASYNIFGGGNTKWYNYSTGGTPLATGYLFDPMGIIGSGVFNTSTAINKTFFVERPDSPGCRVPAVYTISPSTSGGNITGSATFCSDTNTGTLTLSGQVGSITKWESSTNNFNTVKAIANTGTTLAYSDITQTTQFRAVLKSGVCAAASSNKAVIIRPNIPAPMTDYNTCKDATVPVGQGLVNTSQGYTNKVSGTFVANSPTYWRGFGNELRYYSPAGSGFNNVYYQTHTFTPTTTGIVSVEVIAATLTNNSNNTYMALYENSFDPGSPGTNFRLSAENGGVLPYGSKFTDTLTAGTTYILVVSPNADGMTGTYEVEATANIFGNPVNWYNSNSGGTSLYTGNVFNPVGVAGSGILNTATPIAKTFYTGYPALGSCLAAATFAINPIYTPSLTGSTRCSPGTSVLTATGCTGGTVNWYDSMSGTAIATGTSFTTPIVSTTTTYYADCNNGLCTSERIPATAAIGTTDATYSTSQTAGNYQVNQTITSSANVATGVNYFAGKAIILTPGFQAGGEEVFVASIKDCL